MVKTHEEYLEDHDKQIEKSDVRSNEYVKISWTVIFGAILACVGIAIGFNISETRTIGAKYELLQITKLDAVVYWEQHKILQDSIERQLIDIKNGQREMQKLLVEHLRAK